MPECNTELLQEIFDRGLGLGLGTEDSQMCIEAAIALACGEPFSDRPTCVAEPDRAWAIKINDVPWSSPRMRAKALLPLALAQLGTAGTDRTKWVTKVVEGTIRRILPKILRSAAERFPKHSKDLLSAAQRCEDEGSEEAANVAYVAARAANLLLHKAAADDAGAGYAAAGYARVAAQAARAAAEAARAAANAGIYAAKAASTFAATDAAVWAADYAGRVIHTVYITYTARLGASSDELLQEAVSIALEAYAKTLPTRARLSTTEA